MQTFLLILEYIAEAAVLITAVRMYLTVNKLWKRKHEKSVSESISIFAYLLALANHFPFMLKFLIIDHNGMLAANDALNITGYSVIIIIGTGLWVKENRNIGFFKLLLKALHLERKESGDLLKTLIQPSGAKQILSILQKVACLDQDLADEEVKLVNDFARQWKLDMPSAEDWNHSKETNLLDIRESVNDYLQISPPPQQAAEMIDLVKLMIIADNKLTEEENLFLSEVTGMIKNYIEKDGEAVMYNVLIVPQSESQFDAVKTIFPNCEPVERRGGKVLVRGQFFSKEYANAICQKYIALGMFSIWEECKTLSILS
jgi:hypothetical protein